MEQLTVYIEKQKDGKYAAICPQLATVAFNGDNKYDALQHLIQNLPHCYEATCRINQGKTITDPEKLIILHNLKSIFNYEER